MPGTITPTISKVGSEQKFSFGWVSSASGTASGTLQDSSNNDIKFDGVITRITLKPDSGGTAPTDLYDVTVTDEDSVDILLGQGLDLEAANTRTLVAGQDGYNFETSDQELYQTNAYSGTDADVDNTERFTSNIDLRAFTGSKVDIKLRGSGSTDDFTLSLYSRRDTTWTGTEESIWNTTIDSAGATIDYDFAIDDSYGPGIFRFGLLSTGGTDTFEVDAQMRRSNKIRSLEMAVDGNLTLSVTNAGNAKGGDIAIYMR